MPDLIDYQGPKQALGRVQVVALPSTAENELVGQIGTLQLIDTAGVATVIWDWLCMPGSTGEGRTPQAGRQSTILASCLKAI